MHWLGCVGSNVFLATLVALLAWLVQHQLRRPALARVIWLLVLLKLVTPPLVPIPLGDQAFSFACAIGTCRCSAHAQTLIEPLGPLEWTIIAIWSAGAIATGATALGRWRRFRQLLSHASPAPTEWQDLTKSLAAQLSIRRPPIVLVAPGRLPPLVIAGLRRPTMLLPAQLLNQLDESQRSALVVHELTHLKRGDHLVRYFELLVHVAYWWLPVTSVVSRQLRGCEEACCDAAVVAQRPQARRDYARLIIDVLDFSSPLPAATSSHTTAMSAAVDLEARLLAILAPASPARFPMLTAGPAICLACVLLPLQLRYDASATNAPVAIETANKSTDNARPVVDLKDSFRCSS